MSFVVDSWDTIADAMINWIQGNPDMVQAIQATDLAVGSLERAHVESTALAIEQLYQRVAASLEEAVRNACFNAFGFELLSGVAAVGTVTFSTLSVAEEHLTIPAGTIVMTRSGIQFVTMADGTIALGSSSSGNVPIQAVKTGTDGNVAAGEICVIPYGITSVDSVTNASPTSSGAGVESEAARALRFDRYIQTLPRGTASALEYAALSVTGVAAAKVVEPFELATPPANCPYSGLVWLWCDTGTADSTSATAIVDAVAAVLAQWKSAGTMVTTKAVTRKPVKVKALFTLEDGSISRFASEIKPALDAIALSHFDDLDIADPVSHNALMVALASADSAITEVSLKIWLAGSTEPSDYTPADITLLSSSDPTTTGLRATLASGNYVETSGTVAYPYWGIA